MSCGCGVILFLLVLEGEILEVGVLGCDLDVVELICDCGGFVVLDDGDYDVFVHDYVVHVDE